MGFKQKYFAPLLVAAAAAASIAFAPMAAADSSSGCGANLIPQASLERTAGGCIADGSDPPGNAQPEVAPGENADGCGANFIPQASLERTAGGCIPAAG